MHIPDGVLSTPVIMVTNSFSMVVVGIVWKKIKQFLTQNYVPKIALLAAFLFVAQMINIPISMGISAHFVGATLTVLLVGPALGIFVMVLILTVQMFIFQDGGLFAWGANVVNIATVPILMSFFIFSVCQKFFEKYNHLISLRAVIIFLTAGISIQMGAFFSGLEIGLSGLAPLQKIISIIVIVHSGTGILEGIITVIIFELIRANRPDLIFSIFSQPGLLNE